MDRNRKILATTSVLGAILGVILVGATVAPALAHLAFQGIVPGSVAVTKKSNNTVKISLQANATIPRQIKTGDLVGFAWNYSSSATPNTWFAITYHEGVRDSRQNPDGWHAHNVVLGPGAGTATFCITSVLDAPNTGIAINKSKVNVNARNSTLVGTLPPTPLAASFDIVVEPLCPPTTPSGLTLGIAVHDTEP